MFFSHVCLSLYLLLSLSLSPCYFCCFVSACVLSISHTTFKQHKNHFTVNLLTVSCGKLFALNQIWLVFSLSIPIYKYNSFCTTCLLPCYFLFSVCSFFWEYLNWYPNTEDWAGIEAHQPISVDTNFPSIRFT